MDPNSPECIIGWDVGGAHVKAALIRPDGQLESAVQLPCPLWRGLEHLDDGIDRVCDTLGRPRRHAVTMTGELADLFADREQGVSAILDSLLGRLHPCRMQVFAGSEGFLDPSAAKRRTAAVASANWRATAELIASCLPDCLLLDIGSTTTDLIPIRDGRVVPHGHDDATRLASRELLYFGVTRTPLMALSQSWLFEGAETGICNEHFATTADIYRLTGDLPDGADLHAAADGGRKTIEGSARRLARMVGRDLGSAPMDAWRNLAGWLKSVQVELTRSAADRLAVAASLPDTAPVVAAGAGIFLAREVAASIGRPYVEFGMLIGAAEQAAAAATCAPAVAVGRLALACAE